MDVSGGVEARGAGGSICNEAEARAVLAAVRALKAGGVAIGSDASLRVLTFYSEQVRCVRKVLAAGGVQEGVSVGTVDGAQGAEADAIVLSFVRSNTRGAIGFVDDWRRLNVAMTRAKRCLLLIGHAETLSAGEAGEAASDVVRAAARANAIYSFAEGCGGKAGDKAGGASLTLAPHVAAAVLDSAANEGGAVGPKRPRRAEAAAVPEVAEDEAGRALRRRLAVSSNGAVAAARVQPRLSRGGAAAGEKEDDDGSYLRARAAEIASYVEECRAADAEKAARRQEEARAAVAVFAPPY